MKITLSKSQWEFIGKQTGWLKTAKSYGATIPQGTPVIRDNGTVLKDVVLIPERWEEHFEYKKDKNGKYIIDDRPYGVPSKWEGQMGFAIAIKTRNGWQTQQWDATEDNARERALEMFPEKWYPNG